MFDFFFKWSILKDFIDLIQGRHNVPPVSLVILTPWLD